MAGYKSPFAKEGFRGIKNLEEIYCDYLGSHSTQRLSNSNYKVNEKNFRHKKRESSNRSPFQSKKRVLRHIVLRKKQVDNRLISQYRQGLLSNNCSIDIRGKAK